MRPMTPSSRRTGTGARTGTGTAVSPSPRSAAKKSTSSRAGAVPVPPLPRMPSLAGLNTKLAQASQRLSSTDPMSTVAGKKTPSKQRFREPRSSADERDPSTANSTEDEEEEDGEQEDESIFGGGGRSSVAGRASTSSGVRSSHLQGSRASTPGAAPPRPRSKSSNELSQQQQQNICVCIRIRPSAPGAGEETAPIWTLDEPNGGIKLSEHHPTSSKRGGPGTSSESDAYDFRFDSLLLPPHPTAALYDARISSIVRAAMEGYNGTVFSYGQTGSGKTHTMMGDDDEPGIIPQAVSEVFEYIRADPGREYLLRISYLEIYNENLHDLLATPASSSSSSSSSASASQPGAGASSGGAKGKERELRLLEDKEKGRIVVANLTEEVISNGKDVHDALARGDAARHVAGTDWNMRSSRSHCVFSMIIESRPKTAVFDTLSSSASTDTELAYAAPSPPPSTATATASASREMRVSQLNLIDLAGSERATSQEDRRKEGAFINRSLLYLGTVMQKLAEGKSGAEHIPYRDSKLTRLLQTSLSGNARIAIICTISPEARHGVESVSTLKFAARASKITTRAERGVIQDASSALLAKYEQDIADLKAELARKEGNSAPEGPAPGPAHASLDDSDALDAERERRERAEIEADALKRECQALKDQIERLSSQVVTAHSASQPVPATPHTERSSPGYGGIGMGDASSGRPMGPRGARRLSELAFGVGTPLGKLKGARGSARSFSSNLEAVKSPSMLSLGFGEGEPGTGTSAAAEAEIKEKEERIASLQAELADARIQCTTTDAEAVELRERIETLQTELIHVHEKMQAAVTEKDAFIQEAGEQASAAMRLQRQLEALSAKSSETSFEQHEAHAALLAEVAELKETLQREQAVNKDKIETVRTRARDLELQVAAKEARVLDLEERLSSSNAESASRLFALQAERDDLAAQVARLSQELDGKKRDAANLQTQLDEADIAFEKLEGTQAASQAQLQRQAADAESKLVSVANEARARQQELAAELQAANAGTATVRRTAGEDQAASAAALQKAQATIADRDASIAMLREELERKQAARSRSEAAIKAANAPPDYASLQAKIAAVSGRSSSSTSAPTAPLSTSVNGKKHAEEVAALKADLEASRVQGRQQEREAQAALGQKDGQIEGLLREMAAWRERVELQAKLLDEFQTGGSMSTHPSQEELDDKLASLSLAPKAARVPALAPAPAPAAFSATAARSTRPQSVQAVSARPPFGALGAHAPQATQLSHGKSASLNYGSYLKSSSRPGTPTRKDSKHAYNSLFATPEPLPTPPGIAELRKSRRVTIEQDLEMLREGGRAGRSKSILLSPRSERTRQEHDAENMRTWSPMRSKKGSADSYHSVY